MERNTLTTIEKLNVGDRFYYLSDKKKEVWQVIDHRGTLTGVNKVDESGRQIFPWPRTVKNSKSVVFLRSTSQS